MSQTEEIELSIAEAKKMIARKDAANRLADNADFKELILEGYLKEEAIRLGHISADANMKPHREDIFLALQGISLFRQYMQNMIRMGDIAAAELFDHEQALDEVRAEEAYVV